MPAIQQRTHLDWEETYKKHGSELARLEQMLESYEKESKISLTPGAIELIFVPLVEILNNQQKLDFDSVSRTFEPLVEEIAAEPDSRDSQSRQRSSLSVVRAYWKRWSNIPPICGSTAEKETPKKRSK
jgi:hypothetical protein